MPFCERNLLLSAFEWVHHAFSDSAESYRSSFLQRFFHARPTLPRRLLRRARATPVGFEAHREMVAIAPQRLELPGPIDDSLAHGRPRVALAIRLLYRVLAVTVPDAIIRTEDITIRVRVLTMLRCVSHIVIEH